MILKVQITEWSLLWWWSSWAVVVSRILRRVDRWYWSWLILKYILSCHVSYLILLILWLQKLVCLFPNHGYRLDGSLKSFVCGIAYRLLLTPGGYFIPTGNHRVVNSFGRKAVHDFTCPISIHGNILLHIPIIIIKSIYTNIIHSNMNICW